MIQSLQERVSGGRLPSDSTYQMVGRRVAARIETKMGNHTFRATGITVYLKNGKTLEKAVAMANHASTRTPQFCGRRREEMSLDEVERGVFEGIYVNSLARPDPTTDRDN